MTKWMLKAEVEGHLGIEESAQVLVFHHPNEEYDIHVRNCDMSFGIEKPLLSMFLIFNAGDIADAAKTWAKHLDRFLEFLSFATGSRFRLSRPICLFDWSMDEQSMRQGYIYKHFPDPNIPQLAMNDGVVSTVETLMHADDANADIMRALDWFSAGVSANGAAEQFQMFWFCIETLARISRDKAPVADKCQVCREPLYCRTCETVSTHKPFPSQVIEQLFKRFVLGDANDLYRLTTQMRHALMHGDLLSKVEQESGKTLNELVDSLGQLAWVALLDGLTRTSRQKGTVRLQIIQPNTFLRHRQLLTVHVAAGFALGREPRFEEIPHYEINSRVINSPNDDGPTETFSPYVMR